MKERRRKLDEALKQNRKLMDCQQDAKIFSSIFLCFFFFLYFIFNKTECSSI